MTNTSNIPGSEDVRNQASPAEYRPGQRQDPRAGHVPGLLEDLQSLDWKRVSRDDPAVSQLLDRLRLQGSDLLIPIRDLLLDDARRGNLPPALRQALLDILLSMPAPRAESIAEELLLSGPPATEVWQLGSYLEGIRPGQYADVILAAAEDALIRADAETPLPPEFFRLLGELGNEETAVLLAEMQADHGAYATMALASIPDGSGLPLLKQDAQVFRAGQDTIEGRLAIQMLAQQAPEFPEAAAALIELAEDGAIPGDLWPYVLDIVEGNLEISMLPQSIGVVGTHTYYRPGGNQVVYRVSPQQQGAGLAFQSERLDLLDRLQALAPRDP